jgi:hypothetical protein
MDYEQFLDILQELSDDDENDYSLMVIKKCVENLPPIGVDDDSTEFIRKEFDIRFEDAVNVVFEDFSKRLYISMNERTKFTEKEHYDIDLSFDWIKYKIKVFIKDKFEEHYNIKITEVNQKNEVLLWTLV